MKLDREVINHLEGELNEWRSKAIEAKKELSKYKKRGL